METTLAAAVLPEVETNVFDQDDPAEPTRISLAHNRYPLNSFCVNETRLEDHSCELFDAFRKN